MAQAATNQATEQSIEYSIYVHHHPASKKDRDWEMIGDTTTNMKEAMKKAEGLHASGNYHKVEIKQKYFDPKNNRQIDMTLKVLEGKAKKQMSLVTIILFTLVCGAAAFGATVFLVGGKAEAPASAKTTTAAPASAGH
ncbi:MAG: hypothetical protein LRZ85_02175 [Alphaproteobacteria bacterium]|nr:hypothetical protein [Alphaproteobacteria bacterium]MCD8519832.1 hypothetical protein [Alphaproteobacteria bacterium]MCD8526491.1 hypothetical protein [Alphaproteobacteria bacterium]MCD8570369.1 hypothetical protein [Alphaproteobacteria bacterium]